MQAASRTALAAVRFALGGQFARSVHAERGGVGTCTACSAATIITALLACAVRKTTTHALPLLAQGLLERALSARAATAVVATQFAIALGNALRTLALPVHAVLVLSTGAAQIAAAVIAAFFSIAIRDAFALFALPL